jgi:tetratricopeptide (TPR) repeat protein
MGDIPGAIKDFMKAVQNNPDDALSWACLIGLQKKTGRDSEAIEHEQRIRKLMENENEYNRACFEAICGNTDKALALLRIGLEKKQESKEWALHDPDLQSVRDEPRFKELVGE